MNKKDKTMGKIVTILSLAVLLYSILNLKSIGWAIGSLITGIVGFCIGWAKD